MADSIIREGSHGTSRFPLGVYANSSGTDGCLLYAHWHQDLEFFRLEEGTARLITEGTQHLLKAGDIAFIPSGMIHGAWVSPGETAGFTALVFDAALLENPFLAPLLAAFKPHGQQGPCRIFPARQGENTEVSLVAPCLERLFQAYKTQAAGRELNLMSCLYALLAAVLQTGFSHKQDAEPECQAAQAGETLALKLVLLYLQQEYRHPVGVEDMARIARMSPSHFMRYFKRMTGMTAMEYLLHIRLEKAAFLLAGTNHTTRHIAEETGFANSSHLGKRFQERYGLTPARYRHHRHTTELPENNTILPS